jgi:hypothetical protein
MGNDSLLIRMHRVCPHLPRPGPGIDWRRLHAHRKKERGVGFYLDCLEYANDLWRRGIPARAVLVLDRAMGADLLGDEPVLATWPMPYAALAWILLHRPPGVFIGNPRVHFQHYAGRMNEPRREQRKWRAWACWALTRAILPGLHGDPKHRVVEPGLETIAENLRRHGIRGEDELWTRVLAEHSGAQVP